MCVYISIQFSKIECGSQTEFSQVHQSSSAGIRNVNFCCFLDSDLFFPKERTFFIYKPRLILTSGQNVFLFMLHILYELHPLGTVTIKSIILAKSKDKTLSYFLKSRRCLRHSWGMLYLFNDVSPLTWLSMSRADTGIPALCWGRWK